VTHLGGYCGVKECSPTTLSTMENRMTIHGLWPSKLSDGIGPYNCGYNDSTSQPISDTFKAQLDLDWPSLGKMGNEQFWQ